jgi:hypothetical protein
MVICGYFLRIIKVIGGYLWLQKKKSMVISLKPSED